MFYKGAVDEFTSRRGCFCECEYWLVSKNDLSRSKEELTINQKSSGTFTAKIEGAFENSSSVIAQTFLFNSDTVSISTMDYIEDIKKNCIIKFMDMLWRVDSVQKNPIRNNYEIGGDISFKYFLELRR